VSDAGGEKEADFRPWMDAEFVNAYIEGLKANKGSMDDVV
jgi:hypothetical protein